MSEAQVGLLERWGAFLANLLTQQRNVSLILGKATIREQEARLGQVFSQIRHGLGSKLALIRQNLELAERGFRDWPDAATAINDVLMEMNHEIDKNRALIKPAETKPVDLGVVWNAVRQDLWAVAEKFGGSIGENQLTDVQLQTDPDILRTIVFNLVDNALRHGGQGTTVSADYQSIGDRAIITINDTGRGISPSMQDKLFQPMVTTTSDSTGLGLYLSHERMKDLGGELTLMRTGAEGTAFEIMLRKCGV